MRDLRCFGVYWLFGLFFFLVVPFPTPAADIKDSESASHGDSAASYQIVNTYNYPGFRVIQFNLGVISHYSYMLLSGDQALVVDPGRDIFTYLDTAKAEKVQIKGVLLTHSHADFVAGHMELAKALSCPVYANASSGAEYPFKPVKDGSSLEVGDALIQFVETPGHTPDGMCLYVYNRQQKDVPELIFTGDTLFVGSVGRPDLLEGKVSAAHLASMMYESWANKLSKLKDSTVILPAHGAGSLCGAHLSDSPSSTIGAERVSNPYLQHKSRGEFIASVLDGLPEAPQYFKHNAAMNRKGPEPVDWKAPLPVELSPDKALLDPGKFFVVDVRVPAKYAEGHIPNSVNIGVRGRFETWVGIMVPWGTDLVLCGSREELKEAVYRLHRVGYHAGVIAMENWQKAGLPISKNEMISPQDLFTLMKKGDAPIIVDVRLPNEWMGLRIGTVVNLPLNHLSELSSKLDPSEAVITVCNSAYRSSMAVGILERKGFTNASSLAGGSEAWINAGLPVYGSEAKGTGASVQQPSVPKREVKLPQRISAAELKRLIMDLPGTFDLVDIRPASLFADYNISGSQNVDIAEIIMNPAYLTGTGPLIILDRDGTLAMAVAGILSQKTQRDIKALYGGLESYWEESELKPAVREVILPSSNSSSGPMRGVTGVPAVKNPPAEVSRPPIQVPGSSDPVSPAPPAEPTRKKSAGC